MKIGKDLVLDFTRTYSRVWVEHFPALCSIDCSDIEGTDMYCTAEAERELEERISQYPPEGIHFIDSGNYHYVTRLFTRRISEPYNLIFFDNHSDMQPTMVPELMSCGAWAKQVLEEDSNLRKMVLIGPSEQTIGEIGEDYGGKLICVSRESLGQEAFSAQDGAEEKKVLWQDVLQAVWEKLDETLPVYLSLDKDVLSEKYARTNWDQGELSLPLMKELLEDICGRFSVIGADICGLLPDAPTWQEAEVRRINEQTDEELYRLLCSFGN